VEERGGRGMLAAEAYREAQVEKKEEAKR